MKLITFANTNVALLLADIDEDTENGIATLIFTDDTGKPVWYIADIKFSELNLLEGHPYTPWFIQHDLTESDLE